jgi:hypothetical protein
MTEAEWLACTSVWEVWMPRLPGCSDRRFTHFLGEALPFFNEEPLCPACRGVVTLVAQEADKTGADSVQAVETFLRQSWQGRTDPPACGARQMMKYALSYAAGNLTLTECWNAIRGEWFSRSTGEPDPFAHLSLLIGTLFSETELRERSLRFPRQEPATPPTASSPLGLNHPKVRGEGPTTALAILRDIFGNPFRPPTLDSAWKTDTVLALAQGAYDEGAFDHLPILADALEDAGCANADLLFHLRSPGPHVRGCWALDLILGKS